MRGGKYSFFQEELISLAIYLSFVNSLKSVILLNFNFSKINYQKFPIVEMIKAIVV